LHESQAERDGRTDEQTGRQADKKCHSNRVSNKHVSNDENNKKTEKQTKTNKQKNGKPHYFLSDCMYPIYLKCLLNDRTSLKVPFISSVFGSGKINSVSITF